MVIEVKKHLKSCEGMQFNLMKTFGIQIFDGNMPNCLRIADAHGKL